MIDDKERLLLKIMAITNILVDNDRDLTLYRLASLIEVMLGNVQVNLPQPLEIINLTYGGTDSIKYLAKSERIESIFKMIEEVRNAEE